MGCPSGSRSPTEEPLLFGGFPSVGKWRWKPSEERRLTMSNQYVSMPKLRGVSPTTCLLEQPLLVGDECLFKFRHVF